MNTPSRYRRLSRFGNRLAGIAALLLLAVHVFPSLIFPRSVAAEGVIIRARTALPPVAEQRLREAMELVQASELYVPDRAEQIALCNNHPLFVVLAPGHGDSFAYSIPITDHIFIADADVQQNLARRAAPQFTLRNLS